MKGKVMEAVSRGVPSVLSPVAAEGTGLVDGVHCLIAETPQEWADKVVRLYTDQTLWSAVSENALSFAKARYNFAAGAADFGRALAGIGVVGRTEQSLVYRHVRPERYGH